MAKVRVLVSLVGLSLSIWLVISLSLANRVYSQLQSTPIPTAQNPRQITNLQQLLSNEECISPCWLAWVLGEDNLRDAQQLMSDYFERPIFPIQDLRNENGYARVGVSLPTTYPYLDQEGILITFSDTSIVLFVQLEENLIYAGGLVAEQPRWSYVDWSAYRLDSILNHYGTPDEVTITYPIDGSDQAYFLGVRYFNLGIYIHYFIGFKKETTFGVNNPNGIAICNHLSEIVALEVWYQSEELPELELAREWDNVRYTQDYERPLNTVSDLTLAEFTELMSQPDTCFTTLPPNQWQPPSN